jgi:hypothetical protein
MTSNNRRFLRLPVESRVFIELESPPPGSIAPGKVARCETLEVSRNGLRARLNESVTVGAILQIGVELPGSNEPFYLVAQVRWRMQDKDRPGHWIGGFEILNAQGSDIEQWEAALEVMDEHVPGD